MRLIGSAVGAAIAVIVIGLFVYDPLPFCLCLFALACAGLIGFATSRHGYAWLIGAITGDLVMLMALDHPQITFTIAVNLVPASPIPTPAAPPTTFFLPTSIT